MKVKRTLVLSAILIFMFSMTVLAENISMQNGGYAYLNSNYSNGMRNVSAGTIRGDTTHMAYLSVTTTYQNGDVDTITRGPIHEDVTYSSDYEWSEDYSSVHKLYTDAKNCYDTRYLSES